MTPFVGFLPDIDPLTPGVITDCNYCYPTPSGLKTQKAVYSGFFSPLTSPCLGGASLVKNTSAVRTFLGTANKIYEYQGNPTLLDVSRGAGYSIMGNTRWRFAIMGNTCLAANIANVLQASTGGVGSAFSDVAGSPKAKCIDVVLNFVMCGNVDLGGGAGVEGDRWICSAFDDYTSWTPSVTTQCATGRLVDSPGPITAIKALGSDFVAYKESAIYIGRYGGNAVWSWTRVSSEIGVPSQESVIVVNDVHYFMSRNGIYRFDGNSVQPIDAGIKNWFINDRGIIYTYMNASMHDDKESCIYWFYSPNSTPGQITKALVFNYITGKYSVASYSIDCCVENLKFYASEQKFPGFIDSSHTLAYLKDDYIYSVEPTMSITTGLIGDASQRSLVSGAKPHFKATPSSASIADYTSETDGVTLTSQATANMSNGRFDFLASARFHQLRYQFTGNCEVVGHTVSIQPDGEE